MPTHPSTTASATGADRLSILSIEDDLILQKSLILHLSAHWNIKGASTLADGLKLLKNGHFDVLLLDKYLPDGEGTSVLKSWLREFPKLAIIVLTRDDDLSNVRQALADGAMEYVIKSPTCTADLVLRIPKALANLATLRKGAQIEERLRLAIPDDIVGRSAAVTELKIQIENFQGSLSNILITGESGTGKELVARRLWAVEGDPTRPFVVINCGALPENLVESELFGHKKGAFTDASKDKKGAFELADGGDLFLDEVGELSLPAQVKILRALQEKKIRPVGNDNEFKVDVRIIAATNRNLEEMVEAQQFREDLYFRLNVIRLETTPLRARTEDIEDLVRYFMLQMHGPRLELGSDTIEYLKSLPWRGNIRELRNWVERALVNVRARQGKVLEQSDFKIAGVPFKRGTKDRGLPSSLQQVTPESYKTYLLEADRLFVERALQLAGGNISQTAELIGTNRTYLHRKLKDLGIKNSR